MGWNAYAYRSMRDVNSCEPHLDADMHTVFEQANAELRRLVGDGGEIINGELSGLLSKKFLLLAAPISCYEPGSETGVLWWLPEVVRQASGLARWNYRIEDQPYYNEDNPEDGWWIKHANCEVKLFLETCSRQGYAILFTW